MRRGLPFCFAAALALASCACRAEAGELRVSTDFEGGSAAVQSVDQDQRLIRLMPGGDPQRGWPCWWFLRVDGVEKDERITLQVAGSTRPARHNGKNTGQPLEPRWAMPVRAAVSKDRETWTQTEPGRRDKGHMQYEVTGHGGPLWIAWGPAFTPKDTEALIEQIVQLQPPFKPFELAQTRGKRPVRGLRLNEGGQPPLPGVWVQARQHAWESGASWVARGFAEWLAGGDDDAKWLRENAEVVIVPIMDVDNVATGNGGKEAAPRDHNRDWDSAPVYPEVAAAQKQLALWAGAGRLDLFLELHNPGYADLRPFFFAGPAGLLAPEGREARESFFALAQKHISDPLALEEKSRETGPSYHPLWKQISTQWVNAHGNPQTVAVCLETAWNTPHSHTTGYRAVGRQLGEAVVEYLRERKK